MQWVAPKFHRVWSLHCAMCLLETAAEALQSVDFITLHAQRLHLLAYTLISNTGNLLYLISGSFENARHLSKLYWLLYVANLRLFFLSCSRSPHVLLALHLLLQNDNISPDSFHCGARCLSIYGSATVSDSLNGCWRSICSVFGTAALCDALARSAV